MHLYNYAASVFGMSSIIYNYILYIFIYIYIINLSHVANIHASNMFVIITATYIIVRSKKI